MSRCKAGMRIKVAIDGINFAPRMDYLFFISMMLTSKLSYKL